jgi:nucleoside phosphorylase
LSRNPYRKRLFWISSKYVILWDVGDKRGWIVNGASALLHLVRASIQYDKTGDMNSAFVFAPHAFREATEPYKAKSALSVLMDRMNLNLAIYEEDADDDGAQEYHKIRDRVEELLLMLEKMIDHQIDIAGYDGEGFKSVPRRYLEGWDFKDIASREDPIYPRTESLGRMGRGWVDFARSIHAVTLFGRGFGEIIDPSVDAALCSAWNKLPLESYYLAVTMEDLHRIIDRFGDANPRMPYVTASIVWCPRALNPSLRCRLLSATGCCNLAQVLLPTTAPVFKPPGFDVYLSISKGVSAVVFGYNEDFAWSWPDRGNPENSHLQPEGNAESVPSDDETALISNLLDTSSGGEYSRGSPSLTHQDYKIGIVCALEKELMAVRALLDETDPALPVDENDSNCYALGRMNGHKVVAACLPLGVYGTNMAATVASNMKRSFRSLKWYFVVGIGGGVPSPRHDIRLGDVVVSTGVVQSDLGKLVQRINTLEVTGYIQKPDVFLRSVLSEIISDPHLPEDPLGDHMSTIINLKPEYSKPTGEVDVLFNANAQHMPEEETCAKCTGETVDRNPRAEPSSHVHYGLIASSNQVVKNAVFRDYLGKNLQVLCVEMEAAGVFQTAQCLVIRGICDYADSHKNKKWQKYAAAAAAAYCKLFLSRFPCPDRLGELMRPSADHMHQDFQVHLKRVACSSTEDGYPPTVKRVR